MRFNRMLDNVNHPVHYQSASGIEAIDVIEAFELNYNLGNAIKYILRASKKGDYIEDLHKAMWYLHRESQIHEEETRYHRGCEEL